MTTQQATTVSELDEPQSSQVTPTTAAAQHRNTAIEELNFTDRTYDALKRVAIRTVGDLVPMTTLFLMGVPNLRKKGLDEVDSKLKQLGIIRRLV